MRLLNCGLRSILKSCAVLFRTQSCISSFFLYSSVCYYDHACVLEEFHQRTSLVTVFRRILFDKKTLKYKKKHLLGWPFIYLLMPTCHIPTSCYALLVSYPTMQDVLSLRWCTLGPSASNNFPLLALYQPVTKG